MKAVNLSHGFISHLKKCTFPRSIKECAISAHICTYFYVAFCTDSLPLSRNYVTIKHVLHLIYFVALKDKAIYTGLIDMAGCGVAIIYFVPHFTLMGCYIYICIYIYKTAF